MIKDCTPWEIGLTSTAYGLVTGVIGGGISAVLATITGNYCEHKTQRAISFINTTFHTPAFTINLDQLPTINQTVQVMGFPVKVFYDLNKLNLSIPIESMNFTLSEFLSENMLNQINKFTETANFVCSFDIGLQAAAFSATAASLVGLLAYAYKHNQALKTRMQDIEALNETFDDDSNDMPLIRLSHTV